MLSDQTKIIVASLLVGAFLFYSNYLYLFQPAQPSNTALSDNGKLLWQQYNCTSCHQIYGLGGYLGPDLTNVHSKKGPDYITGILKSGTTSMPNFNLNEEEITALIAYFQNLDATGSSDPRTFTIQLDGTIRQH